MKRITAQQLITAFDALHAELTANGHTARAVELEAQLDDVCKSALRQIAVDAARRRVGKKALYK